MRGKVYLLSAVIVAGSMLSSQLCLAQEPEANPPIPCARLDVDKSHSACPDSNCWSSCTDSGYENTSTQAASVNVIYSQCCFCCNLNPNIVYQELVDFTGNVGQYPEQESLSISYWLANHCPACNLQIFMAHKGYPGHDPLNPQNVSFGWAYMQTMHWNDVKIWVVGLSQLPFPPPPTRKQDLSQELTYRGGGYQAFVFDPDCDIGGAAWNLYQIGSDTNGEYLQDYFGTGIHGYLHGVTSFSGPIPCKFRGPSLNETGMIILVICIMGSSVFIMLRRKKVRLA